MLAQSPEAPTLDVQLAFEATESVIRQHSKTFSFATQLLPFRQRRAIRALYAFCRATDDMVDAEGASLLQIEQWREEVKLLSSQQRNPLLQAWVHTREEFGVNPRYEQELIDGVSMDLSQSIYETWEDLERYCYLVASTVGLLSMPIIGLAKGVTFDQAAPYAIQLGIALQLTNILRDVGEDLEKGRLYLPLEDLERFGLTESDIHNRVFDKRFQQLMHFEIQRARKLYREALPGIRLLHPTAQPAVGSAALLYRAILDEIEANQYQVYWIRAHTSGLRKLQMLPSILMQVLTLPDPCLSVGD